MKRIFTQGSLAIAGWCCLLILKSCGISEKKPATLETGRAELSEKYCMPELMDKTWYSENKKAPLFRGLEGIDLKVTTGSEEAQLYFNQGMMLAYGFNHAEAARSFYQAARMDTTCAMAWWGFAYVLGPNYNAGMEPDNLQRAFDAVQRAEKLSYRCTPKEKDLIKALLSRYSMDPAVRRSALDSAYAAQMKRVHRKYPDDPDIAALYAESLMDLHPWDLFLKDGTAQPWTPAILDVLESSLKSTPRHAGLIHFYIHATEMSRQADKALAGAALLGDLAPGSGHLIHMPSHTYIRTGMYHEGAVANMNAVKADSGYTQTCHANGVYPLAYYPHNYHFLAACATLAGESRNAVFGANQTKAHAHKKLLLDPYWTTLQHYYSIPFFVQVKLGRWEEIQSTPEPEQELIYPRAIWHYAQGMAALAHDKAGKAGRHLAAMKSLMQDSALRINTIWGFNSLYDICLIGSRSLEGEIRANQGDFTAAIALLKSAMNVEDKLRYQEPPDWFFSVRHNLGAVLIEAGNYSEAIAVFKKDLETYPENGWALAGLMTATEKLGEKADYQQYKNRFDKAWKHADIRITTSRIL